MVSPEQANPVVERIGILGGTFDPIHIGHLILAEEARIALSLDRVVFMPAAQPWRKAGRSISSAKDRLAMVRLAIEGNEHFEVSTAEIDRGGPTYTVDTLNQLRENMPGASFWFILGADALQDLPNWKEPARIVAQARLAVAPRSDASPAGLKTLGALPVTLRRKVDVLPMPQVAMSSSTLRERLRAGISTRYWLPPRVQDYALDHGLYVHERPESRAVGT